MATQIMNDKEIEAHIRNAAQYKLDPAETDVQFLLRKLDEARAVLTTISNGHRNPAGLANAYLVTGKVSP